MCIERCKHGSGRGLRRPTAEMRQGGAFLLYPIQYANINSSYWQTHMKIRSKATLTLRAMLARRYGLGAFPPTSVLQRKISRCIYVCTACWYNVIDETKIVSSKTVIWLCRFPKHSNIEVLTGAESGKTACLVSIQELLTA